MVPISVLAGLGNPGAAYAGTRHNVGWIVLDALAAHLGAVWQRASRFEAEVATVVRGGRKLHLLKPLTYMNESGRAVGAFIRFHRLETSAVAALYDEVQLETGRAKLARGGSSGGHNGVQSLLDHLGPDFVRLKLGIGPRPLPGPDLKDFVLGKFPADDRQRLDSRLAFFRDGLLLLVDSGLAPAMNSINQRDRSPPAHDHQRPPDEVV